jgi:tungstate transport system substrate-binding protein
MMRYVLSMVFCLLGNFVQGDTLRLAVTTSFENSGLADVLLPEIEDDLGLDVQLLVVGTGQALRLGQAGDVDAILVHSRASEDEFVTQGFGTYRREIMYNDFVLIGPQTDPADIQGSGSAIEAVRRISNVKQTFVSRGDNSGTHKAEQKILLDAGLNPEEFGPWFRAVGAGMGAALNTASAMDAYILADRASWLNFQNKGELALLYAGDPALFNQYAFLPVNPDRHKAVRYDLAVKLEEWLVSERAAELINGYSIGGTQLFVFNATRQ